MKKCIYLLAIMMMAVLNQSCEPVGISNVIDKENQDNVLHDTITPPNNPMDEKPIEPDSSQSHTVLINLAELGDSLYAIRSNAVEATIAEIEAIMARRGYVKFHEDTENDADDYQGDLFFSTGIQVDSTWFGNDMTSEISQLQENAGVLLVTYYKNRTDPMIFYVYAEYFLQNNMYADFLTMSKTLYDYYATTHPFQGDVDPISHEVSQAFIWNGYVSNDAQDFSYNNLDTFLASSLQAGIMSQEEYDSELAASHEDGWRADYLKQLEQPYIDAYEDYEAKHAVKGMSGAVWTIGKDNSWFFDCSDVVVIASDWYGYENAPIGPVAIQKRTKRERTNNARNFIHNLL